jgi:hypothetical protein
MPRTYEHVVRPIDDLKPFGKNPRSHPPQQIRKLTAAIKELGFTNPLLIDEADAVLAGYGRLECARQLNMTAIPCIIVAGLSLAQKRTLMISDNQISLQSKWDQDLLIETLGEISADGFNLDFTGFDKFEIDAMLFPSPFDDADEFSDGEKAERSPTINVLVPDSINVPSIAAVIRKAISTAGFKGVRVKEPK